MIKEGKNINCLFPANNSCRLLLGEDRFAAIAEQIDDASACVVSPIWGGRDTIFRYSHISNISIQICYMLTCRSRRPCIINYLQYQAFSTGFYFNRAFFAPMYFTVALMHFPNLVQLVHSEKAFFSFDQLLFLYVLYPSYFMWFGIQCCISFWIALLDTIESLRQRMQ